LHPYLDKVEQLEKAFFQETGKFYTIMRGIKGKKCPSLLFKHPLQLYPNYAQ
jgi:hypothetical protein